MNYVATVRYGEMRHTDTFLARFSGLHLADKCVLRTERGVEIGEIVSSVAMVEDDGVRCNGEILRRMSEADKQKYDQIKNTEEPKEFTFCQQKIRERGLAMKLCAAEHLFGGTKLVFYFLSQGRVDFRALVKDLAEEYQTRIEMRQIGVRDEARILAQYEHCGRELCCRTFIKRLEPVTMKMAKNQKATLDPNKISGRCGRLMCCLRFEDATYEELRKLLPRKGAKVETRQGKGQVTAVEILCQLARVELEDGRELVVGADELKIIEQPPEAPAAEPAAPQLEGKPDEETPPSGAEAGSSDGLP